MTRQHTPSSEGGRVFWITGLSGAGKTTIGKEFSLALKKHGPTIFLDGDILRQVFGNDLGHTQSERKKCAMRYSRLCKMISDQGIDVVCATISMFHEIHDWNRSHIKNYVEIYLKIPINILRKRDLKGIYRQATEGKINNVMGIDLQFEEPKCPDLILANDGSQSVEEIVLILTRTYLNTKT